MLTFFHAKSVLGSQKYFAGKVALSIEEQTKKEKNLSYSECTKNILLTELTTITIIIKYDLNMFCILPYEWNRKNVKIVQNFKCKKSFRGPVMPQESPSIYGSDLIAKHRHLKIYAEAVILVALNPVSMQCLPMMIIW